MTQTTSGTVELGNVVLTLREDLEFSLQQYDGRLCYLIEDKSQSRFHRLGLAEYAFVTLLDGTTNIREAVALTASQLGEESLAERDAATICRWLVDNQLAHTEASRSAERLAESARKTQQRKRAEWLNPLVLRVPLLRPDRWLTRLEARVGWLFGRTGFLLWLSLIGVAVRQLLASGENVLADKSILASSNLVWMSLSWALLKLIHELAHGVACKRFGGDVREAGLVFIVGAPVPYVDVTSTWRLRSKWQRMFVSAAGMYAELFVAAVAAILFVHTDNPIVRTHARNIMLAGSILTLFFNANPLMRFDGYYILSDALEIPNLSGLGQQFLQHLGNRFALGLPSRLPAWSWKQRLLIATYGLLATVWRLLVCASLLTAAAGLFGGLGIAISIFVAGLWIAKPAWNFARKFFGSRRRERPDPLRLAAVATLSISGLVFVAALPQPGGVGAHAVVSYEPKQVVRAAFDGFVTEVHVSGGTSVEPGQRLLVLDNPELRAQLKNLELEREQSLLRTRQFSSGSQVAAYQVEEALRRTIEERLEEFRKRLSQATVRATDGGTVVSRDVDALLGTYVQEGTPLLTIGDEKRKQLVLSIGQRDFDLFREHVGDTIDVRINEPDSPKLICTLKKVEPLGSRRLEPVELGAAAGGPLPVQPTTENDAETGQTSWELIEPRFAATVPLDRTQSLAVHAGQKAHVRLGTSSRTLAESFGMFVQDWLRARLPR